VAERYEEGESK
jgi:chromosome transmission fidelity protein 18